MKRIALLFAAFAFFATVGDVRAADGETPVINSATRKDACGNYLTASGTAQQTLTITAPPSNQYIYVCYIEVISTATTAPVLTALTHTTTNLGLPTSLKLFDIFPAATGVVKTIFAPGNAPVKSSAPGTPVTIVTNAAVTSITYNVSVWYSVAL